MAKQGNLFYVIGASGVGKDSLMRYARKRLANEARVVFAHRYITRPVEIEGENHVALSGHEFSNRLKVGCFTMHWQSHGLQYGIGVEIDQWMANGINVVMNGSRGYLQEASTLYPELKPILIRVSLEELERRLMSRGRENEEDIKQRLMRATQYDSMHHKSLITISNDGLLEDAGEAFVQLINHHAAETIPSCV